MPPVNATKPVRHDLRGDRFFPEWNSYSCYMVRLAVLGGRNRPARLWRIICYEVGLGGIKENMGVNPSTFEQSRPGNGVMIAGSYYWPRRQKKAAIVASPCPNWRQEGRRTCRVVLGVPLLLGTNSLTLNCEKISERVQYSSGGVKGECDLAAAPGPNGTVNDLEEAAKWLLKQAP